jgi:hypothetical protein
MKRTLIGIGLVATLAFAAVALAGTRHYKGPVKQGGNVQFDLVAKNGVKRVKSFGFSGVSMTCDPPTGTIKINNDQFPVPTMKVKKHRKFGGTFSKFGGHGHISGQFTKHFRKATGTLRVNGKQIVNALNNCDTGTLDWRVHKTG